MNDRKAKLESEGNVNPDNPNFKTPEEEARAAELVRLKAEVSRQARVIEKLKEQRDNLIPFALEEYATPMQVSDYRESLEYDVKDIEQGERT